MEIDDVQIEEGSTYFIAEAGVNHDGDIEITKELVDIAASAGADAVKFQTFGTDRLVTDRAVTADYVDDPSDSGATQREMLEQYELSADEHRVLSTHCNNRDITFLSTPFDAESADLLYELGVPAFKIGSGELTNRPLLKYVASFGEPMIVSTGMGTLAEVKDAYRWITETDPDLELAFLHCTSEYPTDLTDVNLCAMDTIQAAISTPVGYSDHTLQVETPGYAVARGARIVEKHFTLDSTRTGPDHEASLEPDELREAVRIARDAARAQGRPEKEPTVVELKNRAVLRKSIHSAAPIEAGDTFTHENTAIKRPADAMHPAELDTIIGKQAATNLSTGDPITRDCIVSDEQEV